MSAIAGVNLSLRPGWEPPKVHLNILSGYGGLGDTIARLPAFRYLHDHYEHVSATIYVLDGFYDLVRYLLPPTPRREYKKLSEAPWGLKKPIVEFDPDRITSLHLHLTDQAFLMLMDMLPPTQADKAYVRAEKVKFRNNKFRKVESGTVVFTTDFTAATRAWPAVHINTLGRMVREAGLTPVLLGSTEPIPTGATDDFITARTDKGINTEIFLDLRGKTTLIEALAVIQRSRAVVGVDNGLLHLAHCTDVPVVMGFTSLTPEHRVPVREAYGPYAMLPDVVRGAELTKVLTALVPCAGCQSRGFAVNMDWRNCVFDDYLCLMTLTASRFWDKLKELKVVT